MTIRTSAHWRGGSALAVGVVLLSCRPSANEWATSEPMLTGASLVATDTATDRIAGAACRREIACGHVGAQRVYADATECMASQRTSTQTVVTAWGCPSGVIEHSLQSCVERLKSEPCTIRLNTPAQLVECRRMQLCGTTSS